MMADAGILKACLIVLFCLCGEVTAVYKRWITNTDFDNPKNWNLGHLPCPNDRIIFPASSPVVAINQDWTLSNMVLPNDGIIIFGDELTLAFNDNPTLSDNCLTPQDIVYNFTLAAHWLDPQNWCLPMHDFDTECFQNVLQLHTQMVPCVTDDVLFPGLIQPNHRSSFYISLDLGADMEIGTLKIGHQFLSTEAFNSYLDTEIGKMEFIQDSGSSPPSLRMANRFCVDPAGCYCGTDASPWRERICNYVGTCPTAYCHSPLTPQGHCCPICGAKIELGINASAYGVFHMRDLLNREFIQNKDKDYEGVLFDISRLANGNSQITLTDDSQGRQTTALANELVHTLQQDIAGDKKYGVTSISQWHTSGTPETTPTTTTSSSTTSTTTPSTTSPSTTSPTTTSPTTTRTSSTSTTAATGPVTGSTTSPTTSSTTSTTQKPVTNTQTSSTTTPEKEPPTLPDFSSTEVPPIVTSAAANVQTTEDSSGSNTAVIVGGTLTAVLVLLMGAVCVVCFITARQPSSSDPLSISIKFDDKGGAEGGGTVSFSRDRGLDNPIYEAEDGVQLSSLSSSSSSAVGEIRPSTMPKKKEKVSRKKSNGFDNPLFYDSKTETVGAVVDNGVSDFTVSNPLYDDNFEQELVHFDENSM